MAAGSGVPTVSYRENIRKITAVPVQKKKKMTVYGKYAAYEDGPLGINLPQFRQELVCETEVHGLKVKNLPLPS